MNLYHAKRIMHLVRESYEIAGYYSRDWKEYRNYMFCRVEEYDYRNGNYS